MKIFLFSILLLFNISANSNTIEVIELHENKSLDQLVLDKIENENIDIEIDENISNLTQEQIETNTENENKSDLNLVEEKTIKTNESFWIEIEPSFLNSILSNAENIESEFIQNEFNNLLFNLNLDYELKKNRDIFNLIINYFYKTGNLSKAYSLIKSRNIENDENSVFYNFLKMNYLLSTFQLEEVCNFKNQLSEDNKKDNKFMYKIDIFCLILEDKLSEAQLLNSIMLETDTNVDQSFQELFILLTEFNNSENNDNFIFPNNINTELIFLYSAMARIAELPLNEYFLTVDPFNMAIPIILNKSTPIDLRIKAANLSFINQDISIDSLAALYQSVDFNSEQLNNPEVTVKQLSENIDILMSYYFQLINIQIFPSERLQVLMSFWEFAKKHNLEHIAYSLSNKIVDSIEITSEYLIYSPQIALSYIYNKNFEKALDWIDFYENVNGIDDKSTFVRVLLNLYSSDELVSLIDIITNNFDNLTDNSNINNQELIFVLFNILDKNPKDLLSYNFDIIYDQRLMPSLFIFENIKQAINNNDNEALLIYSSISLNNREWKDIHPNHLELILNGFLNYKNNNLIKDIILEIFKNYNIL